MKFRILGALTTLLLSTTMASAAINLDTLTQEYLDKGYTRIEVTVGATEVKIEAIKETTKIEVTYNIDSGLMVKSETDTVEPGDDTSPGVFVDNEQDDESGNSGPGSEDDSSGPGGIEVEDTEDESEEESEEEDDSSEEDDVEDDVEDESEED